ncbi:TraB/GumN family protein [Aureimonas jatrophae]|uniref:TraB family protein n=1 Tax=Aureimonas jatrophae TaxID=1166073 RepID=A0A1H0M0L6_9HYPH|nr:TraB/GumN family protein [Aureimonas jatrophae]MBB3952685.1 hypothetical protein [Aureimonas jatrophae]SDO73884.1 hypothetical protein SAMN05192530_1129 [Aureimonas jatrophae]
MTPTPFRPGRLARFALATAQALPLALCGLLLFGLFAAPAQEAAPGVCRPAESAVPTLRTEGRLEALEREAAAEPNGEGRFYRIERPGLAPSFLFGTMHLSDPRLLALPPAADRALAGASALVIETTDILDPAATGRALLLRSDLTTLPPGRKLADLLPADELDRVQRALATRALPPASVETLQPWFLATALVMTPCEAERLAGGAEVLDVDLASRAKAANKPVEGLETAVEQMEALASLPLEAQATNLVATVETLDRLPAVLETMTDLYLQGRIALIGPVIEAMAPGGTDEASALEVTQAFEERVITARNRLMTERLQPLLQKGGRFVAVGALHLPGEEGVVEALRRAGWQVTPEG